MRKIDRKRKKKRNRHGGIDRKRQKITEHRKVEREGEGASKRGRG